MEGFLERLKHTHTTEKKITSPEIPESDVFFQITFNSEKSAILSTVDRSGRVIQPDYRMYDGTLFNILKCMEQSRQENAFHISWAEGDCGVSLSRNPQMLYLLMESDQLLDGKLRRLQPDRLRLWDIVFNVDTSSDTCHPSVALCSEGERLSDPVLVNESFAICEHRLVRLKSMVSNFQSVPLFKDNFPQPLLEKYLSVLYSNLDNVRVQVDGVPVELSNDIVNARPTIIIEKVDEDKALCLRLAQDLPGIEYDFFEDFRLTRYASRSADGHISVRPVAQENLPALQQGLHKTIMKYCESKAAAKDVYREGGNFIIPEATASAFLFGGLASLVKDFRIVGADKLKGYKVRPVQPKLNVKLGSGIDFLEADAALTIGEEHFTLASFLQQYRRQNYILLADGDKAVIDDAWVRKLERLFSKGKDKKTVISYFDLPEIAQMIEDGALADNGAIRRCREFYDGFNALPQAEVDTGGIKATLRPYQESGIKWLDYLYDSGFGACLADDMGLGKTVQAIALLCRIYGTGKKPKTKEPSLVVMPKSLLFNWASELSRFAPSLKQFTYYGTSRNLDEALKSSVILTTYGMVRSDIEQLREHRFNTVILDESQNIKNIGAQMTHAVLLLDASHRFALSGTPVENNLVELYSLFRFLNPSMFGSLNDFNEKFVNPISGSGDKDALTELRRKIYPYILRRTKSEVLEDLPDRTDQKIFVTLDEAHATFYEQRRKSFSESVRSGISKDGLGKSKLLILQALSELRRIASIPECLSDGMIKSSKIPVLMESLEEAVANGHKIVVFFNFIAGIELVAEKLDEEGIGYVTMSGSTQDRGTVVSTFQENASCKVLLMTLKTGGVGLNLTAADMVYIFEPWWNRAEEEQAIGRLHRIGQKAKVMTFSIIASGTIEDKICQLQEQKKVMVDALISSDSGMDKQLSEEDIDFLLN